MFLSDELEQIYSGPGYIKDKTKALFDYCLKTLEPYKVNILITRDVKGMLTQIKRIDYTWRNFCKAHPELKPDGFRNAFLAMQNLEQAEKLKKELNW